MVIADIKKMLNSTAFNNLTLKEQEKFLNIYMETCITIQNSNLFNIFKVKFVSLKEKE